MVHEQQYVDLLKSEARGVLCQCLEATQGYDMLVSSIVEKFTSLLARPALKCSNVSVLSLP